MDIEDYKFIEDNLELVKKIIINASCSSLPLKYRDEVLRLGKKYHFINCSTCNTGIYLATSKLYDMYVKDKNIKAQDEKQRCEKVSRKKQV